MAPLFFSENNLTSLTKMKSVTLPVIFFYSFHLPCVYVHGCPLWHWCWSVTLPVEYLLLFHLPCIYVRGCPVWHQCWLFRMELYIAGTVHPSIRHQQGQAGGSVAWRVVYIPHLHYQVSLCGYGMGAEVEPFSIPVAVLICSSFSFVFTPPQPAACFKKIKVTKRQGSGWKCPQQFTLRYFEHLCVFCECDVRWIFFCVCDYYFLCWSVLSNLKYWIFFLKLNRSVWWLFFFSLYNTNCTYCGYQCIIIFHLLLCKTL